MHIAQNKRQNVEKRAKIALVNGILPYLDRIANEVKKLSKDDAHRSERLQYVSELVERINEYNDILTQWIQLSRGELSLHVEDFALNDLFDIMMKSKRNFAQKGLSLEVVPTDAVVKADRMLTLFMINTLADNARKFTEQGKVSISATSEDKYVEISVSDTGVGLSADDIQTIVGSKVYDARQIGEDNGVHASSKGHGFGLMNCKGIIEKYRKTSTLFDVCLFGIESHIGKGSRFYFRLPKGTLRLMAGILVLFSVCLTSCTYKPTINVKQDEQPLPTDRLLRKASSFADSTFNCNVTGRFNLTLVYADSAIHYLNAYYNKKHPEGTNFMKGIDYSRNQNPSEIIWWDKKFVTDYHVILGVRNEAAVAALVLHRWDIYRYNNHIYTQLYRLTTQDTSLESYCRAMKRSNANRQVSLVLLILLIVLILAGYYVLVARRRLLFRMNLKQMLEVNREVLNALSEKVGSDQIDRLPVGMLHRIFPLINEIHLVSGLWLNLFKENGNLYLECMEQDCGNMTILHSLAEECKRTSQMQLSADHSIAVYPLLIDTHGKSLCIGTFAFITMQERPTTKERLLDELMVRYLAIILFQTVVHRQSQYDTLNEAEDEKRRARYEESLLHVQNMVLDNCLSTIKHETMYYPNRILQLVKQIQDDSGKENLKEHIHDTSEIVDYYREIFTLLSEQAARQLENVNFRRERIDLNEMLCEAQKTFQHLCNKKHIEATLVLQQAQEPIYATGDIELLRLLLENLFLGALSMSTPGSFILASTSNERFAQVSFTDTRPLYSTNQTEELFSPDIHRIPYLLCKQIIRDHDEFMGHPGCRIVAETLENGGRTIWFSIPLYRKAEQTNN
jgi:hypothetical protein